jgi:SAM-dependent methyltransferase
MVQGKSNFDYHQIPLGFYDNITVQKKGMRSFWHNQKFKRIIDIFDAQHSSILDIGCFSGTFLNMIPERIFFHQVGVDILKEQIDFANEKYGTPFREFHYIEDIQKLDFIEDGNFEYVSVIEVIEHLNENEISDLIGLVHKKLSKNGKLILTTPNYISLWPLLEIILNRVSDVKYEEQHITRFNYFNVHKKMNSIVKDFDHLFTLDYKTTTHFLSPYLAILSYKLAEKLSSAIPHRKWNFPFGSLILIVLSKKETS